jgi:nucleoside-diphosphate-sugar epimerase
MDIQSRITMPRRVLITGTNGFIGRGSIGLLSRPGTYSVEKARWLLGYTPCVDLATGMRRSETWARETGLI